MLDLMPPTAIQHHIDGRWGFKSYAGETVVREWYWSGAIYFRVRNGTLLEPHHVPPYYGTGGSHELERAVYLGIPLVHVEFV